MENFLGIHAFFSFFLFFVIARAQSVLKSFHLVKGEKSVNQYERVA